MVQSTDWFNPKEIRSAWSPTDSSLHYEQAVCIFKGIKGPGSMWVQEPDWSPPLFIPVAAHAVLKLPFTKNSGQDTKAPSHALHE